MLTYDLDKRGNTPLYEYLYKCIRRDIRQGVLCPGEKLPSKRNLAANHSISVITVENAYEQLLVEGYIYAKEKRGYFVSEITISGKEVSSASQSPSVAEKKSAPDSEKQTCLVDFTSNHTAYDKFPFATWARLSRRALLDEEGTFLQSPSSTGLPVLRQAIADYLLASRGFTADPDRIIVGAGTEYLYGLVVQLLGRSGMIAVEDPGHIKVSQIYESNGIKVLHIPVDREGFSLEALGRSHVSAIHISPSHHFPTGIVMPAGRRHRLVEWARAQGSYIIEDEYDSEFRFVGRPIPAMAELDSQRVIYMNTFSKSLSPSVRIAYMVLPEPLMKKYRERLGFYSSTVSGTEQLTLARFIGEGYLERHINRTRNYYREYRKQILDAIAASGLGDRVTIEEQNAGLHFILCIRTDMEDEVLLQRLAEQGIRMSAVSAYCYRPQKQYDHKFIMNYSDVKPEDLKKAWKILESCIQ